MIIYNNLDSKIKNIFIFKLLFCHLLLICDIYCLVILSLKNISYILILILIINLVSLILNIRDVVVMMKDNKRIENAWLFDLMYGISSFPLPLYYFLTIFFDTYHIMIYELIIMSIYSIIYLLIIIYLLYSWILLIYKEIKDIYGNKREQELLIDSQFI